ncbi:MAG: hypothetical protein KAS39_07640, partial [Actinomycetia bacterium]|nr:hypothetical protein [Actinomycetes bacterium]
MQKRTSKNTKKMQITINRIDQNLFKGASIFIILLIIISLIPLQALTDINDPSITTDNTFFELLPNGHCTGSILETIIMPGIFNRFETGGISRLYNPFFNTRGVSWQEMNWSINGVNISDPGNSGFPIFEPAWNTLRAFNISARNPEPG